MRPDTRKDLIAFFVGLGVIMATIAPMTARDVQTTIVDYGISASCFIIAYITRHAVVKE